MMVAVANNDCNVKQTDQGERKMNWLKTGKQLLLIGLMLATLITTSISVAWGQEPDTTARGQVYLPLVASGATDATPKPSGIDQIIVHYKEPDPAAFQTQATQLTAMSEAAGVALAYVRELPDRSMVVRLPQALTDAELQPILAKLAQLPEVAVVEPDVRVLPQLLPNDPRYGEQWHYFAPSVRNFGINLPGAWDVTTGDPNLVVAVLDTGQLNHEDLVGRMTPGYDFISNAFIANDGDGRDPDPSDEGDGGWETLSTWHGTHIAGTIGARSNNGLGVTGINWNSKIQHVRVLGISGGLLSDIIDATYWAAGLSVPGVPANPTPARVLNMSFGIGGACPVAMQNAINAVVNRGSVVVVSAGNETIPAANFLPANCNNVITVGATDRSGDMAFYSNYGAVVELAAPGGEVPVDAFGDGILSTLNTGILLPEADSYQFYQGTSMAAPHVTGIISLMLSVNPTLTPAQVLSILQSTVTPFPAGSACHTQGCGAGLVNAMAAVTKAKGGPMAPTNLQTAAVTANQITLRWTDTTSDETGFKVERCQGAGCTNYVQIGTVGANGTSYTDPGLTANTIYNYRVRTTKNGTDSAPSNVATGNTSVTAGCTIYASDDTIRTIPELATLASTITAANLGTVTDVNLRNLNIEHSFDMDLAAVLVSPTGRQVELFNAVGGAGANFSGTMLDDEASTPITNGSAPFSGSYRPSSLLSAFDGQGSAGLWSLRLSDNVASYEGWLYGWSLELCTSGGGGGTNDLLFEDGFESGGFGRWTATSTLDGGDLSVNATAALVGTRGMSILIDDTRALYVTDDTPAAEARYRARFRFDPNGVVLPNALAHYIFYGYQGTSTVVTRLEFRHYNGAYQLRGSLRRDDNTWRATSWYPISDAPHVVELDWQAATAPGANNGSLTLWIDGAQKGPFGSIDNDAYRVDRIRLGAIAGLDAGTQGSYFFDAFKSTRSSYIGPNVVGVSEREVTVAAAETTAMAANVVEEDLSLDDVGIVEEDGLVGEIEEAPKQ
jgi:subtilisin family serine protease/subtilisin-like proprotein convertase family protein